MLCRIFCRYWLCNCHCRRARRCWLSRGLLISVSVCRPVCRAGGHSLATSVKLINVFPLTVVWPGLIVTVVVVALNIFGDVLRDAIDPVTNPALREIGGER